MIRLKNLKVGDILYWHRKIGQVNDCMLGKVETIDDTEISIRWYFDSDPSKEAQDTLTEIHTIEFSREFGHYCWLDLTELISEKESLAILLSQK